MADNRRTLLGWVWPPPPIARQLWIAVVAAIVYSFGVWAFEHATQQTQPVWFTQFAVLNSAIIGLLVSFRTKVAYDRWWEGRMLWGALVNHSRNLCLKARELAKLDASERDTFATLVTAFSVALLRHLRGSVQLNDIPGFEKDAATPAHVPAHLAGKLIATVAAWRTANRIDGHAQQIFDPHLAALMDVCGACERIRNTPLPTSYLSLLRHGLVLGFLITPWALDSVLDWWVIIVHPIAVYFVFGIELTAEAVEQPFGFDGDDLPLGTYCETICKSATDILA